MVIQSRLPQAASVGFVGLGWNRDALIRRFGSPDHPIYPPFICYPDTKLGGAVRCVFDFHSDTYADPHFWPEESKIVCICGTSLEIDGKQVIKAGTPRLVVAELLGSSAFVKEAGENTIQEHYFDCISIFHDCSSQTVCWVCLHTPDGPDSI
jgi:hypothetical protein